MKKNIVYSGVVTILTMFVIFVGFSFAQEQSAPEVKKPIVYEWPGVKCDVFQTVSLGNGKTGSISVTDLSNADGMLCRTDYPLMTDRLATYGTIKTTADRSGATKREFDFTDKNKLTIAGDALYKDLMQITIGKLFAIYQAPIGYNSVTIIPYEQVPWNEQLTEPIRKAFERAQKLDEASQ